MPEKTLVESAAWGATQVGEAVTLYTLTGESVVVKIATYGARLISICAPDRNGTMDEVVLGADELLPYLTETAYLGAIVGRFGNRIDEGKFVVDGLPCQVPLNDGPNCLHGGPVGFDRKNWVAEVVPGGVAMTYVSPAGEMGFPGTLTSTVTYTLSGNTLTLLYEAVTDAPTVVNLTNHAYFNLGGEGADFGAHTIKVNAEHFTPVNATLIPTGELRPVAGTPLDLRSPKVVAAEWDDEDEQMRRAGGYDHNWVLLPKTEPGAMQLAAVLAYPASGRTLTVSTTEPGIQFYSGNFLSSNFPARGGGMYARRSGCCLETQHFPDTPNQPEFPSATLRPGETMRSVTQFTFGVMG